MAKKSLNRTLNKANKSKNDDFYTQLTDIEKELKHYKQHFKNKVVLITGASSGIGRESAIEFAKLGATIVLVSRRKGKLEQVADELKKFRVKMMNFR